jgi:hypothetical protein
MIALFLLTNAIYGQTVTLGSAANFVFFTSNGAVANTGTSNIIGDIGSDVGAISGFGTATVTGSVYNANTVTAQAKIDLQIAYNQINSIPATVTSHAPAFGGGETITVGVYTTGGAGSLGGNLTLNGLGDTSAVFIFRFGGAFAVGAASKVILINGARACNVFWVAEGAISMAATTTMKGNLIANNAAVSMAASGDLEGRMFSTTGAISFGPSTAMKPSCGSSSIISTVILPTNINMGTAGSFVLFTSSGAVGNTGSSVLTGNVGSDLGAITGFGTSTVTGSFYNADATTHQAKIDLQAAYNQIISIPITNTIHAPAFGGGEILTKGVYYIGAAGSVGGNLTLDAQGDTSAVFIFRFNGAFSSSASTKVCLINRALPCKVFWVAEGAIAMAASTTMKGTLIANNAAVSMAAGGYLQGRLLSTAGAVTFGPGSAHLTCQMSYTWASTGSNLFSGPLNWSPTGNPACSCMDNVFYNSLSNVNCDFDQTIVSVNNFSIMPGYTSGSINAQSNTGIVNADFGQSSGLFSGSTNSMFIYGNYRLNGGIYKSTSGTLTTEGAIFCNMSGTFMHNNGTVVNNRPSTILSTIISGAFTFNKLELTTSGNTAERHIDFNSSSTTATLTLNGGANAFGYSGKININSALIIDGTNTSTLTLNTGTFCIVGSGIKTITGTGANFRNPLSNIEINTNENLAMFNNINVEKSWTNTTLGSFTAGTSTVNIIGTGTILSGVTAVTQAYFDNLNISTSSTLTIIDSSQINIGLNLTDNGLINTNKSLIRLNGTSTQEINGSATLTTINALEITSTGNKSLLHKTNILDSVKINDGTLVSGAAMLTLKSTDLLKGRIAEITGSGSVVGTITVETFALGTTTDWAVLGASGINGLTMADWEGQIPMSCSLCPYNEYSTGSYFVSIQGWDELAASGSSLAFTEKNYNSTLNIGQGYWIYLGNGFGSTSSITYSATGTTVTGNKSIGLTNSGSTNGDGYNLISNPYPSPISWAKLRNGNTSVSNAIYIYNADLGLTTSYVNGVSSPFSPSANDVIPMGQGFYVQALANTTLVAKESNKISNNTSVNQLLKTTAVPHVFRLRLDGFDGYSDETVFRFEPSSSNNFDNEWDANKIYSSPGYVGYPGAWSRRTAIATKFDTIEYSINSFPAPIIGNIQIPVIVRVYQSGQYTISPIQIENIPIDACVSLFDKVTSINHDLKTGPYICIINDTTYNARFILTICASEISTLGIKNNNAPNNSINIINDELGATINLAFAEETEAKITVRNILGQNLMNDLTVYTIKKSIHLNLNQTNEILLITVTTNKECITKKIMR